MSAPTMKISENPMESEFCILNGVSRTEVVVANAHAPRANLNSKEPGR